MRRGRMFASAPREPLRARVLRSLGELLAGLVVAAVSTLQNDRRERELSLVRQSDAAFLAQALARPAPADSAQGLASGTSAPASAPQTAASGAPSSSPVNQGG